MNVTDIAQNTIIQINSQEQHVKYLLGTDTIWNQPLRPYGQEIISFFNDISTALLRDSEAKQYPDIVSYAFWCRKAHLMRLKENACLEKSRIGRGLVFHITPSNIPVNFVFSYSFSLLAGNANIVRLPSQYFPQVNILTRVFESVLKEHFEIARRTAWIQYPANGDITAFYSRMADARMLWGGDQTIRKIRLEECNPKSTDLCFADRYSSGLIDGNAILGTSEQELGILAENFYNDTWLMDQNACSSPRILFWLHSSEAAKTKFWSAAVSHAKKKYRLQPASAVDKYLQACNDAINCDCIGNVECIENLLYRVHLRQLPEELVQMRGNCGYFYEYDLEGNEIETGLNHISHFVTEKYQTVTYFGIDPNLIQKWVLDNGLRGIDRIVPFGKAMDVNVVWDGYDVIRMLSRIVNLG